MIDLTHRLRCRYPSGPIINGEPEFGWRDFGGPVEKVTLPTPIMLEAAALIETQAIQVTQLREAINNLLRGYVNLMEAGRDRIKDLGGDCDPVDVMEASDPWLKAARAALTPPQGDADDH